MCDDGSDDLTASISEKMGAIVVKHKKNLGYGVAIRSLFSKARELECDILVTFDSDGQAYSIRNRKHNCSNSEK